MNLGMDGLQSVCLGLRVNKTITHLDLSNNYIGSESAQMIAEMIEYNDTLEYINLSNNNLEYNGEQIIKEAAKKRQSEKGIKLEIECWGN